ncbi:MAG: tyrosine--tRNA ligase [Ilumatobacteraceae bacterium]
MAPHDGNDLLADLEARNLIHDSTDREALRETLRNGSVGIYYGCDPTADSLHVGNLIGLIMLRRFQDAGHRPIALAGGATGMVGDPSGRSDERNLLDDDTLNHNVEAIKGQIGRIVDLGEGRGELVDNRDWTQPISILEFLRDVGKHVTVNQMLARESIKLRVNSEHGISFTEFSYMLLQANDYLWLHEHLECAIQIGGSDQWGNIIAGVDLIRRKTGDHVHAFSWPLLTAADGSKLGKTTGARTWLDADKTSPYQFRQHWMQTPDEVVAAQLLTFSLRPVEELRAVMAEHEPAPHLRVAQRSLADEMTALVHGAPAALAAAEAADLLFAGDPTTASEAALDTLRFEIPFSTLTAAELEDSVAVLVRVGLATSNGDARRSLQQGSFYVNGARLDANDQLTALPALHGRYLMLRKGKKSHHLVEIIS